MEYLNLAVDNRNLVILFFGFVFMLAYVLAKGRPSTNSERVAVLARMLDGLTVGTVFIIGISFIVDRGMQIISENIPLVLGAAAYLVFLML